MKRILSLALAAAMLLVGTATALASENVLNIGFFDIHQESVQEFAKSHSEAALHCDTLSVYNTDDLINAFLTDSFSFDVFPLFTASYDLKPIIDKGYLADLSGSPEVIAQIERMYEPFRALVSRGEAVYGLPYGVNFDFLSYDPIAWEQAELTESDVPDTFGGLLDFLESWIERAGSPSEQEYCVYGLFDSETYCAQSYTMLLTTLLLDNYTMQLEHAGQPLQFDTPTFRQLLDRCTQIGAGLYKTEPVPCVGTPLIINQSLEVSSLRHLLSLRISTDQPMLIKAYLSVMAVYQESP